MPLKGKASPVVFLDASCLVAAVLSPTGGSFRLLQESSKKEIHLVINRYAFEEVSEVLARKYPHHLLRFEQILAWSQIKIQQDPSAKQVAQYLPIIDPEDAPILAGAMRAKARFLVTLDRSDFMTATIRRANLPFIIVAPRDFFQQYWKH